MAEIVETEAFAKWLKSLRDLLGRRAIIRRLARIASTDNFGDHASVGEGVSELRIDVGPGYRVYYTIRDGRVAWLLGGGDKDSQVRDIKRAKELAGELE
jgi:putative addiction module killer protein